MATPAAVRAAYLRKARASHPDAGGTKQEFQTIQAAYERLGTQRKRQASIDERYYSRRPNDVIDRINHRLSRPLGNLVPTRYKIAFRLGALLLVLCGAVGAFASVSISSYLRRRGMEGDGAKVSLAGALVLFTLAILATSFFVYSKFA